MHMIYVLQFVGEIYLYILFMALVQSLCKALYVYMILSYANKKTRGYIT